MTYVAEQTKNFSWNETEKGITSSLEYMVKSTAYQDQNFEKARSALPYKMGSKLNNMVVESINLKSYDNADKNGAEFKTLFLFTINFSGEEKDSDGGGSGGGGGYAKKVSFRAAKYEKPFELAYDLKKDTQGNPSLPVQNSFSDIWSPGPNTTRSNLIISLTYTTSRFDPGGILNYQDTVNAGSLTIAGVSIPKGKGKINMLSAEQTSESTYSIQCEIEMNPNGWVRKMLDCGFNAKSFDENLKSGPIFVYDGGYKVRSEIPDADIKSNKAILPNDPVKLDGNGLISGPTESTILEFPEFWEADWTPLCLPFFRRKQPST